MKSLASLFWLLLPVFAIAQADTQTCVTLKPGPEAGFDAEVWSLEATTNFGDHDELRANAWTWSGDFGIQRSFFRFQLDTMPDTMVLVSATLNLFGLDDPDTQLHAGDNDSYIQRVTEDWSEFEINWDNQPATTTVNQLSHVAAVSGYEDFTEMDVTDLVSDMIEFGNFGFMLRLQNELTYRRLGFASSDHINTSSYPELVLCWEPRGQQDTTITENPEDSCWLLKPGPEAGYDAEVWSLEPTVNFGDHDELRSNAWTWSGNFGIQRSFFRFNLDTIPPDKYVASAELSLFALDDPDTQLHAGDNDSYIRRVTEDWDEFSVNWDNQPASTVENQVTHEAATWGYEDFLNMDVTEMVRDMVEFGNYGFIMRLQNEATYRRLGFASSDHINPASYPELLICLADLEPQDTTIIETPGDTCITLKPGPADGIDAEVWSLDPNTNFGTHDENRANAWTWDGQSGIQRSFLRFSLDAMPEGAILEYAGLSLFALDDPDTQLHAGENQSYIRRVIEDWDEATITWDNQPAVTATHEVEHTAATSGYEDFTDIDVTELVQDMIDTENYGFMLRLQSETTYRRLGFASSDHVNAASFPELELCYTVPTSIIPELSEEDHIKLYPNPANQYFILETPFTDATISVYAIQGELLMQAVSHSPVRVFDISTLPNGTYIVKIQSEEKIFYKKINII